MSIQKNKSEFLFKDFFLYSFQKKNEKRDTHTQMKNSLKFISLSQGVEADAG